MSGVGPSRSQGSRATLAILVLAIGVLTWKLFFLVKRNADLRASISAVEQTTAGPVYQSELVEKEHYVPQGTNDLKDERIVLLFTSERCEPCPPAAEVWQQTLVSQQGWRLQQVHLGEIGTCERCRTRGEVLWALRNPIDFFVRTGIDQAPLAVAVDRGEVIAVIGGLPSTELILAAMQGRDRQRLRLPLTSLGTTVPWFLPADAVTPTVPISR